MTESASSSARSSRTAAVSGAFDPLTGPRAELARAIPRRARVQTWMVLAFAVAFAIFVTPAITATRVVAALGADHVRAGVPAKFTVRVPPLSGADTADGHVRGGVLIGRGELPNKDDEQRAAALADATPRGVAPLAAYFALAAVLAGLFAHHVRRSNFGRLVRVQLVNLGLIAALAIAVEALMLTTSISVLTVPVALLALLPTLVLDRVVGLATGTLAALVVSLLVPFDVGVAIVLLVQAATAGLVVAERPKHRFTAALVGGGAATLFTTLTYPLFVYLTSGHWPIAELSDPLHSSWLATAVGPLLATVLAVPLVPLYQLLVGEITHGQLVALEDLSHPLLRQIADRAPGTWQHSLMMANMAELAANEIGANGRLVRVGAYFHDLGKSLSPKHFVENLEPGETSPHDQLPPELSCDAIFRHVTDGIVTARRAGLHDRVVDFMHMHHGNGVLEYFWAKCQEQGNLGALTIEHFRYPGVAPQTRETAILAICDAVEAASRTLKKPDTRAIEQLVQRIVYGKLYLGQLDDSGLSMADLRHVVDSLRETIRHANHGRIEYPWQHAREDASASGAIEELSSTGPRLDSLDPVAKRDSKEHATTRPREAPEQATPRLRVGKPSESQTGIEATAPVTLEPARAAVSQRPSASQPPAQTATPVAASTARPASSTGSRPAATAVGRPLEQIDTEGTAGRDRDLAGGDPRGNFPTLETRPRAVATAEVVEFARDAKEALDEAGKDIAGTPREPTAAVRKRAATIPPVPPARRPPTAPPVDNKATLAGLPGRYPATTMAGAPNALASKKPLAELVEDETSTTNPRLVIERPTTDAEGDRVTAPAIANDPELHDVWKRGLASRIDAALDDFGSDTPIKAPTRAELQALTDAPPDATRLQSFEELERLKLAASERESAPELQLTRRAPYPTAEVDENDIEVAIELAPPARRTAVGVAKTKKKPTE